MSRSANLQEKIQHTWPAIVGPNSLSLTGKFKAGIASRQSTPARTVRWEESCEEAWPRYWISGPSTGLLAVAHSNTLKAKTGFPAPKAP